MKEIRRGDMPAWAAVDTETAKAWRDWAARKVEACFGRAGKHGPTRNEWRVAVVKALCKSSGIGHYSGVPMTLDWEGKHFNPFWPSIEHLEGPGSTKLALECRLVNDMVSIMGMDEFKKMIAHLADRLDVEPAPWKGEWMIKRSFGA